MARLGNFLKFSDTNILTKIAQISSDYSDNFDNQLFLDTFWNFFDTFTIPNSGPTDLLQKIHRAFRSVATKPIFTF